MYLVLWSGTVFAGQYSHGDTGTTGRDGQGRAGTKRLPCDKGLMLRAAHFPHWGNALTGCQPPTIIFSSPATANDNDIIFCFSQTVSTPPRNMILRPSVAALRVRATSRTSLLDHATPQTPTLPRELLGLIQQHHRRPIARHYASVSASELQFGQPVYETHPHVLKPGESESSTLLCPPMCLADCLARPSSLGAKHHQTKQHHPIQ